MAKRHIARVFRVKMSERMAKGLEELVNEGYYVTYADAIRHALDLIIKENLSEGAKEYFSGTMDRPQEDKVSSSSVREIKYLLE